MGRLRMKMVNQGIVFFLRKVIVLASFALGNRVQEPPPVENTKSEKQSSSHEQSYFRIKKTQKFKSKKRRDRHHRKLKKSIQTQQARKETQIPEPIQEIIPEKVQDLEVETGEPEPVNFVNTEWTVVSHKKERNVKLLNRNKKPRMNVIDQLESGQVYYQEKVKDFDLRMCRYCKHIRPPVDYNHPLYSPAGDIVCPKFGSCFICRSQCHTPKYCPWNPLLHGLVISIYEAGPGCLKDSVIKEIRRLLVVSIPCRFCLKHDDKAFNHCMQNEAGEVTCPVLNRMRCFICGETGSKAHTAKFCPNQSA